HWTVEDHQRIRDQVPKLALATRTPGGRTFRELAEAVLEIAHGGLAARRRFNASGDDETGFLDPLREIVRTGKTPAEVLLDRYNGEWRGDIGRIYEEMAF
ncbi:MAG TPA: glutamate--cysteine ligase, partial [Sphingomonas sp.]|nr:glutamate--cysteine ligase [Sphingomonas sp.]